MNFKTTLTLLIVLVLVGGYMLFIYMRNPEVSKPAPTGVQTEAGTPLIKEGAMPTDAVTRIELKSDGRTTAIERVGKEWMLTETERFGVNEGPIETVLSSVRTLRYTQKFMPARATRRPSTSWNSRPRRWC